MTLDHAGAGLPPQAEAAILFGFGRAGPPIGSEFAKAWKYQAPSSPVTLAQEREMERTRRTEQYWPPTWSDGSTWDLDQPLQQEHTTVPETQLDDFLYGSKQPVGNDRIELEDLLGSLRAGEALEESWLESVQRVLETSVDEIGADKLISTIEALHPHPVPVDSWKAFASILERKFLSLTASNEEVVRIFKLILERTEDWEIASLVFAARFGQARSGDPLLDVLEYIILSPRHESKLKTWLTCLKSHHHCIQFGLANSRSWRRCYCILAQHFQPSDPCVIDHFGKLRRTEFAQILLEFYLPAWIDAAAKMAYARDANVDIGQLQAPKKTGEVGSVETLNWTRENTLERAGFRSMDYGSLKSVFIPFRNASAATTTTTSDVRRSDASALSPDQRLTRVQGALKRSFRSSPMVSSYDRINMRSYAVVDLVRLLQRYQLPYVQLLDEVFEVYMQTQSTKTTKNLFVKLREQKGCAVPTTLAGKLVRHFIAAGSIDYAFYVFRDMPTLPLLPYSELLLKLIEGGKTHGQKIFEMLQRYHPEERVPSEWREHPRLNVKPEHVKLVHEVAYAFASSEHLSPRTAFRRVWECFRYLRDRRAPLQPLISRALVKAGISRPLKERDRLSREQVKYVVSIVDQIEGAQIANEVDRIVWEAWDWTLERQWSSSQPQTAKGPAGQGRYHENKRRLWIEGGGRVYMPFPRPGDAAETEAVDVAADPYQQVIPANATESNSAGLDSHNGHAESFVPFGTSASLMAVNTAFDQLHYPATQPGDQASDEPGVIDSDDTPFSVAEMNETLSAPSGGSPPAENSSLGEMKTLEALTGMETDTVHTVRSNDPDGSRKSNTTSYIVRYVPAEEPSNTSTNPSNSGLLQKRIRLRESALIKYLQRKEENPRRGLEQGSDSSDHPESRDESSCDSSRY